MSRNARSSGHSITRFVRRACSLSVPLRASPIRLSCSSRSTADRGYSGVCRTLGGNYPGACGWPRLVGVRAGRRRHAASRGYRLAAARGGPSATGAGCSGVGAREPAPHHLAVSRADRALSRAGWSPPSFDLRRFIRPELLVQILPAIEETSKSGVPSRRNVTLDTREISIEVIPLAGPDRQSFLILFDDGTRLPVARSTPAALPAVTGSEEDRRLEHM